MELASKIALIAHIAAGTVGVLAFFIPIAAQKGSAVHRAAGWVFADAMLAASITGLALAVWTLADDEPSNTPFAWFLIYIATLTAFGAAHGLRMLRFKQRTGAHQSTWDYLLPTALLLGGPALMVYGITAGNTLLATFPAVGVFLGGVTLCYLMCDKPKSPAHWKIEHMTGMFTAGIAAITAFLVTGAARIATNIPAVGPDVADALRSPVAWFVPTAVLVPILVAMTRREKKRVALAEISVP